MFYDDHEHCEKCSAHVPTCWCHPADELEDYPDLFDNLCPGGPGHGYLGEGTALLQRPASSEGERRPDTAEAAGSIPASDTEA